MNRPTHILIEADPNWHGATGQDFLGDPDDLPEDLGGADPWMIEINLTTGFIKDWRQPEASGVVFTPLDIASFWLTDAQGRKLAVWEGHEVPGWLPISGEGEERHIDLDVDPVGGVQRWVAVDPDTIKLQGAGWKWVVIPPDIPAEPEAVRHSFDGFGWFYADNGNGSDWVDRALKQSDAEPLYTADGLIGALGLTPGALAVLAERQRQITAEGWSPAHDDTHDGFELSRAAMAYIDHAARDSDARDGLPPKGWPWDPAWFKGSDPRRELVKATALLLAEIERLDRRATAPVTAPEHDEMNS